MKVNSGVDPSAENQIFSADKAGFGNQLWADDGVIAETQGLWFYTDDNDPRYNDCLQITDGGIRLANTPTPNSPDDPNNKTQRKGWWNYKMVVPSVPADAAVYLRMKRDETVPADAKSHSNIDNADVYFLASRFNFGVASAAEKTNLPITADRKNQADYSCFKVPGTTDEWIVAIKNTTGKEDHLTFTLNGWILEKVAVSTDFKKVNVKGWTTESRDHVIDPELTAYMTGEEFETCLVTGVDYAAKTVKLTRMGNTQVMSKLQDGNKGANIIHNKKDGVVEILKYGNNNSGFHLFVPDMHDYDKANNANGAKTITDNTSMLVARVSPTSSTDMIPASNANGDYTNYALTYKYYKLDADGKKTGNVIEGDEAFYRIATGGATSSGNQGYLPLLTEYVDPHSSSYGTNPTNTTNNAKFSIIFEDEFEIEEGIATAIEEVQGNDTTTETDGYYTLSGTKVNRPTQSGLYIRNGKKVYVK